VDDGQPQRQHAVVLLLRGRGIELPSVRPFVYVGIGAARMSVARKPMAVANRRRVAAIGKAVWWNRGRLARHGESRLHSAPEQRLVRLRRHLRREPAPLMESTNGWRRTESTGRHPPQIRAVHGSTTSVREVRGSLATSKARSRWQFPSGASGHDRSTSRAREMPRRGTRSAVRPQLVLPSRVVFSWLKVARSAFFDMNRPESRQPL